MLTRLADRLSRHETINFLVTNRIPRRLVTRFVGWLVRIETPLVRDLSIAVWKLFAGNLRLEEAKKTEFASLHDCFVRELKDGVRPIDPDPRVLVSPCDAIVGAAGALDDTRLLQAKGRSYTLGELLGGDASVDPYRGGWYVTLRLTAAMYHRFHAPADCDIVSTTYISGDVWNVNPAAVKRIARLYCRNERAIIQARLAQTSEPILLVAVGAILVASIHLNFVDVPLNLQCRGVNRMRCDAAFFKGDELGYFHHGSTIIVIAPASLAICDHVKEGAQIRMGEPLMCVREDSEGR
ncbi:MAG TPA: archaetidylserine decarboxylase [Vicinamibacterales bacterium]|nr:archaetidylserine decarboxylase [Vicinamibacterales bacterium]